FRKKQLPKLFLSCKPWVGGSSPLNGTIFILNFHKHRKIAEPRIRKNLWVGGSRELKRHHFLSALRMRRILLTS
ncbi:MAG: hypothetical protein J6C85_08305, partial [Alphaproteobacteria bacterium]|nr:hypothetical protein [Alphaproteobacteria bacterium]